ncbi:hypothetical protein PFISCL1PPCAC_6754, partial [Pristionchus fissidentatus]
LRDEMSLWCRPSASGETHGPYSVEQVMEWYERREILVSAQFSFDGGLNWESIVDLRRRNGPYRPFVWMTDTDSISNHSPIEYLRELVESLRNEVDELDMESEMMIMELDETELMLEKMNNVQKIKDREEARHLEEKRREEKVRWMLLESPMVGLIGCGRRLLAAH